MKERKEGDKKPSHCSLSKIIKNEGWEYGNYFSSYGRNNHPWNN
jgi:hypothetical protein